MKTIDNPSNPFVMHVCESDDEWLSFRNEGIGGSDVSTIIGVNKYKSPLRLWLEKTGRVAQEDISSKEAVEWGNRLEATIRDKFAEMHPEFDVTESGSTMVSRERPWAHANLDGIIESDDGYGILEIKTVGRNREHDWDDGVPDYYVAQVTHYMSVTGWKFAYVAALVAGQHYIEYRIDRDDDDVSEVESLVDDFWNNYVAAGVTPQLVGMPDESSAILDMYGIESQDYVAPENADHFDTLVHDYQEAKACEKKYAEQAKRIANDIRAIAGSNNGVISDVYKVTWVKSESSKFDQKRFKDEHPDLADEYTVTYLRDGGLRVSEVK